MTILIAEASLLRKTLELHIFIGATPTLPNLLPTDFS